MSSSAATDAPPALRMPGWASIRGLVHGFFGRAGGVSAGPYASLNVSDSVGDDAAATAENWRRIGLAFPGLAFVRMSQVHGARVLTIDAADAAREEADEPPPEQDLMHDEDAAAVAAAVSHLPAREREVLVLRHYHDLPFPEVARLLGEPVTTVKSRMARALERLKAELTAARPRVPERPA